MAKLLNCRTCKKEVARGAKTCPHCGEKNPTKKKISLKESLLIISIFIVVGMILSPTEEERAAKIKEDITKLETELKTIPASQYQKNYFLYSKLVDLAPKNTKYKKKLAYYKVRYDLQESISSACMIESRARNKAALNNPQTYDSITFIDQWDKNIYYYQEEFLGKNSFGVESKFISKFRCSINKNKSINIDRIFIRESL